MRCLILFILFCFHLHAFSVTEKDKVIPLLEHATIYHDMGNKENITSILAQPEKFSLPLKNQIDYCNLKPESVWIKFTLNNESEIPLERIISINNLTTEEVTLYEIKNNQVLWEKTTGLFHLDKFAGTIFYNITFTLQPHTTHEFYLYVKNEQLSLWFKPELFTPDEFYKKDSLEQLIWALFFGGILSLAIYNAFLFFFTKDRIYFYYLLYLVATLMQNQLSLFAKFHLFPMESIEFIKVDHYFSVFYINVLVTFAMALFIRCFLNTPQYKKIDITLRGLIYMIPLYFILQLFNVFTISQVVLFQFFTPYYFLWIGFYALYKKNPQAKFFIMGWSLALLGWLSVFFQYMGIFPVEEFFAYTFEVLIISEVILFAIFLAYRIKSLEKKKNDLTKSLLIQQRNESRRLEQIVQLRTQELNNELKQNELLLKELHHRVKNNMQFITSLYALKLNDNNDTHIQEKLYDVERKIHAMSIVHQMLYNQKNLVHIDAKEYFEKVLDNIKNSFELDNITFHLNINATLDTEEAIYCGLIVNELVTNAIKHAFDGAQGIISIELHDFNSGILLKVSDNGKGIVKSNKLTFGQMMVESLAQEQLEGELKTVVDNGTHISLWFKNKKYHTQYND